MRRRGAGGGRHAGRRGANGSQRHDGHERQPGDHPAYQQDRPPLRRARAREGRNRGRPCHPGRRRRAGKRQNGRGRARPAGSGGVQHPRAAGQRRRTAARAHLRQLFRPVPRRRGAGARGGRLHAQRPEAAPYGIGQGHPGRRGRCAPPRGRAAARAFRGRGRIPGHGPERPVARQGGRHHHAGRRRRGRAAAWLPRGQAHGVHGPVPHRLRSKRRSRSCRSTTRPLSGNRKNRTRWDSASA